MLRESTSRLLTALRLALYPALESAEARHFQALTREAQNARLSGDLANAERLYLTAVAEFIQPHPSPSSKERPVYSRKCWLRKSAEPSGNLRQTIAGMASMMSCRRSPRFD